MWLTKLGETFHCGFENKENKFTFRETYFCELRFPQTLESSTRGPGHGGSSAVQPDTAVVPIGGGLSEIATEVTQTLHVKA